MGNRVFVRREIREPRKGTNRFSIGNVSFRSLSKESKQRLSKIGIILVSIFILGSIIAHVAPSVDIVIIPETRVVEGVVPVTLDSTVHDAAKPGIVPASHVKKEFKRERSVPTTGKIDIGSKSKGKVTFTNRTGVDFPLLSDQRIRGGENMFYTTVADIVIPRASVSFDGEVVPGTIEAEVEAESGGSDTSLQAGKVVTITTVPPERQDRIFGYVSTAIAGGSSKVVQSVAEQDIVNAVEEMISAMKQETREEVQKTFGDEYVFHDNFLFTSSVSTTSVPALFEPASEVTVKLSATIAGVAVKSARLEDAVIQHIKSTTKLGPDEQLSSKIQYSFEQQSAIDQDAYQVNGFISYSSVITIELPIDEIKKEVVGKPVNRVRQMILSQRGVRDVHINQHWNMFSTLPTNPDRIHITSSF